MQQIRLILVGFGVVGQGFAELLAARHASLKQEYHLDIIVAGVATARYGLMYRHDGLDIATLLLLAAAGRPLGEHPGPGIAHWPDLLAGLSATRADVLLEATPTNLRDGEPGMSHIHAALAKGMHVVTANKGPIALAAPELFALAHRHGVQMRVEATVMAGTPVISTIREGMAGAQVQAIRGILNGTTNYILTAMTSGLNYEAALAEAQAQGYAETDPTADVGGYDAVAKILILAALVFHHPLNPAQVTRQGITDITPEQVQRALEAGQRLKLVGSLALSPTKNGHKPALTARVEPLSLPFSDPLARVNGITNAITISAEPFGDVTIIGPGAGRIQTGQGLLADILMIARSPRVVF